jgi:hypothetical protein
VDTRLRVDRRDTKTRLYCVPIEFWLRLVLEDHPDLAGVINPLLQPAMLYRYQVIKSVSAATLLRFEDLLQETGSRDP